MKNSCSTRPELLAPAGNAEVAVAAFDGGADAVYCGLGRFNARERAENFTPDSLGRIIGFAHDNGKKVYVTLNTLVLQSELVALVEALGELASLGPDALIVQDFGVLRIAREYFPRLPLHASTQMGIHNSAGVAAAARLGLRRVILERQVTLDELREIAAKSPLELEIFIHGSLCCSLSGRCLLSSAAFPGSSGNRGKCKQPCRKRYDGMFKLSPDDLRGIELLPELRKLRIASLKIEGRLRPPEYVWKTARAYRLLLDGPENPEPERVAEAAALLDSTSGRSESRGFFFAGEFARRINPARSGVFGPEAGRVEKISRRGMLIRTNGRLHLGDRLRRRAAQAKVFR